MGKANRRKKMNPTKAAQYRAPIPFVDRPYAGLIHEAELVAMRELIPCATLPGLTNSEYGSAEFDFVTLLPDGVPAMVRPDGRVLVGLQTRFNSGDLSHDAGGALVAALKLAESGEDGIVSFDVRDEAPRLQDILDPTYLSAGKGGSAEEMVITGDFEFWFAPDEERDEETQEALVQNREDMVPTEAIPDVHGMYWCEMNNNFVRVVSTEDEDKVFTALARMTVEGSASFGENSKFVGAFRACGIPIPVFQVDSKLAASDLTGPAKKLQTALVKALKNTSALTDEEKRVRAGLVSRQVTIR